MRIPSNALCRNVNKKWILIVFQIVFKTSRCFKNIRSIHLKSLSKKTMISTPGALRSAAIISSRLEEINTFNARFASLISVLTVSRIDIRTFLVKTTGSRRMSVTWTRSSLNLWRVKNTSSALIASIGCPRLRAVITWLVAVNTSFVTYVVGSMVVAIVDLILKFLNILKSKFKNFGN